VTHDRVLDPEGAHIGALRRLGGLHGARVLEMGCGDGRLTAGLAADAAQVVAFDPDAEAVARARGRLPPDLGRRVTFLTAGGLDVDVPAHSFDITVFSWSL
jgi:ubiquinone/menaquinone biosynthesis C-methylase UbiE